MFLKAIKTWMSVNGFVCVKIWRLLQFQIDRIKIMMFCCFLFLFLWSVAPTQFYKKKHDTKINMVWVTLLLYRRYSRIAYI